MRIEIHEKANGWIVEVYTVDVVQFERLCKGSNTTVHKTLGEVMERLEYLFERI